MPAYKCPYCTTMSNFGNVANSSDTAGGHILFQCHNCSRIVYGNNLSEGEIKLVYPQARSGPDDSLPEDVKDNFKEAIDSLSNGNYKASVIMSRSALQSATRLFEAKGQTLYAEIEDLAKKHVLPDSIKDWAHELRDGGNLVAHPKPDKKVVKEDAEELVLLAESIFEYLFVIPKQVQERRNRRTST